MSSHVQTLRNGFPGPRVAGVALIIAPLLMVVAAFFLMEFEGGTPEELMTRRAEQPLRSELGANVIILGWATMTIALFALARLVAARKPTLATVGALLAFAGICVSLVFSGIASIEHGLSLMDDRAVALQANEVVMPPLVLVFMLPGVILGWPILAIGAWRAGVLGPARAVALAGTAGLPIGPILGFAAALPVVFLLNAIALVPLGIDILRAPSEERTAASAVTG